MKAAPIGLFVFDRLEHARKSIDALKKNASARNANLWIFSDQGKCKESIAKVRLVREYIRGLDGFADIQIIEQKQNIGLAQSIIGGVNLLTEKYGRAIVVEDDLIVSPQFLDFMNAGLNYYSSDQLICSISGFTFAQKYMNFLPEYPIQMYTHYRPMSWGWSTWGDRWKSVDWNVLDYESFMSDRAKIKEFSKGGEDLVRMLKSQLNGEIDSWYVRWAYHAYKKQLLTIYPKRSFVKNIGHDGSGTHSDTESVIKFSHSDCEDGENWVFKNANPPEEKIIKRFNSAFNPSLFSKLKNRIYKYVGKNKIIFSNDMGKIF